MSVWQTTKECQNCGIMCNSCWRGDHTVGAWFPSVWVSAGFPPQRATRPIPRARELRPKVKRRCEQGSVSWLSRGPSALTLCGYVWYSQTFIVQTNCVAQVSLKPCGLVSVSHWYWPWWPQLFQHCLWTKGSRRSWILASKSPTACVTLVLNSFMLSQKSHFKIIFCILLYYL